MSLVVAQVRSVWFHATETFLHTTVAGLTRTRALLLGQEEANTERFPVAAPRVVLTPPGSLAARWNRWRTRLGGDPRAPLSGRRALRALRRHGAGLLHAHFGQTGVYVLPLARRSGLPLITTFYGQDASRLPRDPAWRERFAELFAAGACFLVEGPHLAESLVRLGCPRQKIRVQPLPIVASRYPFRARLPRPAGEPVRLLFCARFCEKKGLHFALEAVARARREHPALRFHIVGDGPQRAEVEADIERLGLRDCVALLGMLPHARLIDELDAADVLLQPSVTAQDGDTEGGAPTTLLEAQACGLPVLATRHADIPFVVADGESGLLAAERDVEGLTAHLLHLLKAPERWAQLGAAGRERVERFHDAERALARLEDLYFELAAADTDRAGKGAAC
jgi:colanic acid/amylovoran biosynthesis glycosyltransferase